TFRGYAATYSDCSSVYRGLVVSATTARSSSPPDHSQTVCPSTLAHTDAMKELRLTLHEADLRSERFLASGDESGTAPGDRPFRPDVEGLRAVAVLLVVLFHSGVSAVSGGFIGVDVFFVISGFVITGVLLRERASTGSTSLLAFYGRRCRRIIPAATLVITVTVFLSYFFLSSVEG